MKSNEKQLSELMEFLGSQTHVRPEEIPDIDLYMDQVTTFMEEHLKDSKRYKEDKVLTKTMINNYAKNNLLPPPVKKKYSRDHMLMLIFIYYFKSLCPSMISRPSSAPLHPDIFPLRASPLPFL